MTYRLLIFFVYVNIYRFSFNEQFVFLTEQLFVIINFFTILFTLSLVNYINLKINIKNKEDYINGR